MENEQPRPRPRREIKDDGGDTTCWTKRTRFQMALFLILFISVPFLIIMLLIYLGNTVVWNKSEECEKMCKAIASYEERLMINNAQAPDRGNPWLIPEKFTDVPLPFAPSPVIDVVPEYKDLDDSVTSDTYQADSQQLTKPPGEFTNIPEVPTEKSIKALTQVTTNQTDSKSSTTEEFKNISGTPTETSIKVTTQNQTRIPSVRPSLDPNKKLNRTKKHKRSETLKTKELFFCKPSNFPFIAILLEHLYMDSNKHHVVRCTLAVLSSVWLLTTKHCLDNQSIQKFSVRINSDYWSKDGTIKKIERMVTFKEFVALKLERQSLGGCLKKLTISDKIEEVVTLLWKDSVNEPLEKRKKFEKIKMVDVKVDKNIICKSHCDGFISPLVDRNGNFLIGFQKDGQVVYYVNTKEIRDWLIQLIKETL